MFEELSAQNFEKYIESGLKVVLFYANWCGYCKRQFKELDEVENIKIGIVDIDNNKDLVERFMINSFPTFVIFKRGREIAKFTGLHSKSDLLNKFVSFLQ